MTAPTEQVKYRKLTGVKRTLGAFSRLWLAPDHLLHVTSTGYTESYRRYYFRDIQGITLQKTAGRVWGAVIITALTVLAAVIAAAFSETAVWVVLGLGGGGLLWNHLLGQGCRGVIITAVQRDPVPSLARVPAARRVLARIRPLILAAQADLPRAGIAAEAPRHSAPPLPVGSAAPEPPPLA